MPGQFIATGTVIDVKPLGSAGKIVSVTLSTDKTNKRTGDTEPTFVTVKMFAGQAERAPLGTYVVVLGVLEGREYEGKFYTDLMAQDVDAVMGGRAVGRAAPAAAAKAPPKSAPADSWGDDYPIQF